MTNKSRALVDTAVTAVLIVLCAAAIALFMLTPPDATVINLVYRKF